MKIMKSSEIKRVRVGEGHIGRRATLLKDLVEGNPQFRTKKENKHQAAESVDFLQEQGTQRTRVDCKRKSVGDTRGERSRKVFFMRCGVGRVGSGRWSGWCFVTVVGQVWVL